MITSLTERLVGKGIRHDMKYEEQLMHNAPAIAQNGVMFETLKVENNTLHIMTALVIMPQPATLTNLLANLLYTLV